MSVGGWSATTSVTKQAPSTADQKPTYSTLATSFGLFCYYVFMCGWLGGGGEGRHAGERQGIDALPPTHPPLPPAAVASFASIGTHSHTPTTRAHLTSPPPNPHIHPRSPPLAPTTTESNPNPPCSRGLLCQHRHQEPVVHGLPREQPQGGSLPWGTSAKGVFTSELRSVGDFGLHGSENCHSGVCLCAGHPRGVRQRLLLRVRRPHLPPPRYFNNGS